MADMMQSMMRFSWAMSLFGVKQAVELVSSLGTARAPRHATSSFDAVSRAAEDQLDDGFGEAFRTGSRWQGDLIDAMFGVVDPAVDLSRDLASRTVLRASLAAFKQSAAVLQTAMPEAQRILWQELTNKLEAFEGFQYVDQILGFEELEVASFRQHVEQAVAEAYSSLWLTEGLGFAWAEAGRGEGDPRDLLRRPGLETLPSASLIPRHTGMGLSLARHALADLDAPAAALPAALARFWEMCERNARDGFALASYEALGLIVSQLAPDRVGKMDVALERQGEDPDRRGAFWHGLGRGLYFVASQSMPGSTGRAVGKVRQEAPAGAGRLNALSGLAWALTLVNFRHPEILEAFLDAQEFEEEESAAVSQGIASAALLWVDAAGEGAHLEAFLEHRPAAGSGERWLRMVSDPYRTALNGWKDVKSGPGPGAIFHYRRG